MPGSFCRSRKHSTPAGLFPRGWDATGVQVDCPRREVKPAPDFAGWAFPPKILARRLGQGTTEWGPSLRRLVKKNTSGGIPLFPFRGGKNRAAAAI